VFSQKRCFLSAVPIYCPTQGHYTNNCKHINGYLPIPMPTVHTYLRYSSAGLSFRLNKYCRIGVVRVESLPRRRLSWKGRFIVYYYWYFSCVYNCSTHITTCTYIYIIRGIRSALLWYIVINGVGFSMYIIVISYYDVDGVKRTCLLDYNL